MTQNQFLTVKLSQISAINPKKQSTDFEKSLLVSFLPMKCVSELSGEIDLSENRFYTDVKKGYTQFLNGDILFAKITPCMENGKIAIADNLTNGIGFGSTEFHVVRLHEQLSRKFYFYYLIQEGFRREAQRKMTGSAGQLRVPKSFLEEVSVPLPPLPEQHRIVEKIEEEFTRLDAGVAELKKAKALIPKYRQSVLKSAMCGDLTQEWRAENPDAESAEVLLEKVKEKRNKVNKGIIDSLKDSKYQVLPNNWIWKNLADLAWDSGYGTSIKCSADWEGHPILRIPNLSNGKISLENLKFAPINEKLDESKALKKGDLLIIRTNGSKDLIGRSAIVRTNFDSPHYFASYLIRYRLVDVEVIWLWLGYIWNSNYIRSNIEEMAATTAGQYNINLKKLNKLSIPLPPLPEQHEIVNEIERRFSVIDEVERAVDESLVRAESLRQSILKKAFEGKLVPQDPDDEPASVLLERILAEKKGKKEKAEEIKKTEAAKRAKQGKNSKGKGKENKAERGKTSGSS